MPPSHSALQLSLVPREPRFAVRLPLRMSRAGTVPVQVALPKAFHDRLRVEVAGSLNHALIALARQALAWLDDEKATLRITVADDPLSTPNQRALTHSDWRRVWNWPHRMFEEVSRESAVVVSLDGRPSRSGVVFVQIGLPVDLQERLREQGVGSVSQLLVYLARYAFMRLEALSVSLHVGQTASDAACPLSDALEPASRAETATVGELMQILGAYPPEAWLRIAQRDSLPTDSAWIISEQRDADGQLVGVVLATDQVMPHPTGKAST